jgi:two-component system, NarL family, invasion response regulator UvrY
MTHILLTDDHAAVRKGVRDTLHEIPGVQVRWEAGTIQEALAVLEKERVDLMVLDISMPGGGGLEMLEKAKRRWPKLRVLVYTMHPETEFATHAFKLGVAGYLTKHVPLRELVQAVKSIIADGRYISPRVGDKLAVHLASGEKAFDKILSRREVQVMKFIASGTPLTEIAKKLKVNAKTISSFRARILRKLKLRSNADLTLYALKKKIIRGYGL